MPQHATEALIAELGKGNDDAQRACAVALGSSVQRPEISVPALIEALNTSNEQVKREVLNALTKFKQDALPALDQMVALIDDDQYSNAALSVIGAIGPPAKTAVPQLIEFISLSSNNARLYRQNLAIEALGDIGPDAKAALPVIEKVFKAGDEYTRSVTGKALWKIDPTTAEKLDAEKPKEKTEDR